MSVPVAVLDLAVEVAGIARGFASEKLIASQLLRGEGIAAGKIPVKFRRKRADIGSDFIGGDGLGEFVEGLLGTSAIRRAESQGSGAAAETGGAFRGVAYRGHIGGPIDLQGACAPDLLEEEFVLAERQLIDDAGSIWIGHLLWIEGRVLALFRGGVLQAVARGATIPEIAAVEIALGDVVLQRGIVRCIHIGRRIAFGHAIIGIFSVICNRHRAGIRSAGVDAQDGSAISISLRLDHGRSCKLDCC